MEAIVTTPPLTRGMEEQMSQTSSPGSGTHLSNASGFSLGEAIVQRAKQGSELWPQLQAEADIGRMTSASDPRLLLAGVEREQTLEEFPTMEEGMITITEESLSTQMDIDQHQPTRMLELQESGLSPALPLLAFCSTQNQEGNLSNTFFHHSQLEFAPLRGTPDLSGVSHEGHPGTFQANSFLQAVISEVSAECASGCLSLSQHPLGDTRSACSLSQHSLTPPSPGSAATEDQDFPQAENYIRDQHFMEFPNTYPDIGSSGSHPHVQGAGDGGTSEVYGVPIPSDVPLLDQELPAPLLLDLLEQEMGLPNSGGFTSSSGSSTQRNRSPRANSPGAGAATCGYTALNERTADQPGPGQVHGSPQRSDTEAVQPTQPDVRSTFPKPLGNGNLCSSDSGRPEVSNTMVQSRGEPADNTGQAFRSEASSKCRGQSSSGLPGTSINSHTTGARAVTPGTEPTTSYSGKDDTIIEVQSTRNGDSKSDGTGLSGYSTEREHKDTELSPTACPPDLTNSSFLTSLANPICQSTPSILLNLPGKITAQLDHGRRAPDRLTENQAPATGHSKFSLAPAFAKQDLSSSSQAPPGTLQSLPPLSYMEKVGAWNLNRCPGSRISFDSLALHGLRGVSPRQRAYSAIADSLNHILSRANGSPASDPLPKRNIAAAIGAASQTADRQPSAQSHDQSTGQWSDAGGRRPFTSPSPGGPRGCSARRGSTHDALLCESDSPDSFHRRLKAVLGSRAAGRRSSGVGPLDSSNALDESRSSYRSGAGLSAQDNLPDPNLTNGREIGGSAQSVSLPGQRGSSPGPCPSTGAISAERFDRVSPDDDLDLPASSQDTSRGGEQTLTVSGHSLTSLEVDNYVPIWAPSALTPDPHNFNIEDRIPIYLRNLGINQSPTSILGSNGPSRQVDFAPFELKKLRGADATMTKGPQGTDGLSPLGHVSRCSFYSDTLTHSTSIPMGSETGRDTPFPMELSPGLVEKVATDQPIGHFSSGFPPANRRLDFQTQHPAHASQVREDSAEGAGVASSPILGTASSHSCESVSRRVGRLLSWFESTPDANGRDSAPFGPSSRSEGAPSAPPTATIHTSGDEPFPPSLGSRLLDHHHCCEDAPPRNDSFIGLKTLSEIRKLLGEAGNLSAESTADFRSERPDSNVDAAATLAGDEENDFLSRWADTSPQTVTTTLSSKQLKESPAPGVGAACEEHLTAGNTSSAPHFSREEGEWQQLLEGQAGPAAGVRHVARDEPEGCSGVTADKAGPRGGKTGAPSEPANRPRACSSPPNSLARLTRSVSHPQAPSPETRLAAWPRGARAPSDESGAGGGVEEGSGTDSLAARVAILLRDQCPTELASNLIRAADAVEQGAQDWEKIKPANQPPDPLSILDEEDRRKIEEIKSELLRTSKNFISSQDGWLVDAEDLSLPPNISSSIETVPEIELPALPAAAFLSVNTARSQISSQLRKLSDNLFDTTVQLRTPLRRDMDERLKAMALDSPASGCVHSAPSQLAKPIVAITFSSRRRPSSSSPQVSPGRGAPLPTPLPEETSGGKPVIADRPGDHEEPPGPGRPQEGAGATEETGAGPVRPEQAQPPSSALHADREERPPSSPEQRKQPGTETSFTGQTPAETGELPSHITTSTAGIKPHSAYVGAPSSSPIKTVLSHLRLTLSPKRSAATVAQPGHVPVPSRKLHFGAEDVHGKTEGDSALLQAPPPTHGPAPSPACPVVHQPEAAGDRGPPYPPLPMPVPAFYSPFPPLFDYPSEARHPGTAQQSGEARPVPRFLTGQDGSKVDVWTQTVKPLPSAPPVTVTATAETMGQDVSAQTERTQPGLAQRTSASTTATTGQAPITRRTDVPVMLPYRPAGSSKLFYMPHSGTKSRTGLVDSESSSESSQTDSQDAPPTRILTEALGTRGYGPSNKLTKHREIAYGKAAAPKISREKEEMRLLERGIRRSEGLWRHQSSLTAGAETFPETPPTRDGGAGGFYTGYPDRPETRSPLESRNRHLSRLSEARHQAGQRELSGRRTRSYPTMHRAGAADGGNGNQFWPLAAEADDGHGEVGCPGLSYKERAKVAARSSRHGNPRGQPATRSSYTDLGTGGRQWVQQAGGSSSPGGAGRYSSLDELWERFKERQKRNKSLGSSSASELSLLERLDQLARFLRNPVQHSLLSVEEDGQRRRKVEGKRRRKVWEDTTREDTARPGPAAPLLTSLPTTPDSLEEISTDRIKNILNRQHYLDTKSESSAGLPATESETPAPTETQTETEVQTETGSTASTIDTARLVRAFGPERVTVLPLSRLYGTIQQQKESSAHRRERPRRAERRCTSAPDDRQVSMARSFANSVTTSDSASTVSPSARPPRGPSSRLVSKKGTRLVNQGVQAGTPEIVPSTTRRQTRDVGVTFPSPDSDTLLRRSGASAPGKYRNRSASPTGRFSSGQVTSEKQAATGAKDRRKKGSSHSERRPSKGSRAPAGPAIAWFVPANELKSDSRKENALGPRHSPVPPRFQSLLATKPWREPLQEKYLQEQWVGDRGRSWSQAPARDDLTVKTPSPLIRLTLNEALHMNRPSFVSHSRERVRRLELLMEERKLQSILQSERERLFNQPAERGPRDKKGYNYEPDDSILFKKKIPKKEMFDRSKRLYEQLPEVARRREEEKRKAEYQTYRLKAQLYKKKITNHVLGRKVSWQ
ncbi:mucin-12 isoform X2 [Heptranchias perlo]|uniref:mucin-12 isoform X2 n=1 Tax=Heptranchias perlo TaxID=212740 RepID=UPI003559F088